MAAFGNRQRAVHCKSDRIDKEQRGAAIALDQMGAVPCKTPAAALRLETRERLQQVDVIDEADFCVGQLINLVSENCNAFSEVIVVYEPFQRVTAVQIGATDG